jgi:hypothetical protein
MSVCVRPSRYFAFSAACAVSHVDRTAHAEFGLVEQEGEGVLRDDRIGLRPAENALAMRHRMNAELTERGAFELTIRRVVLDPLRVAAETIALMQHRDVTVSQPRRVVQRPAGQRPEPIKMRRDVLEEFCRQMNPQQIGQRRIGAVEVHAGRIGRDQVRCGWLRRGWLKRETGNGIHGGSSVALLRSRRSRSCLCQASE